MPDKVKLIFEPRAEANLRKLARALIALAQQAIEKEAADGVPASKKKAS